MTYALYSSPHRDPLHELEMSQALLRQAMRRLQGLPPGHRGRDALVDTVNGLTRDVEWWRQQSLREMEEDG
jgi:hypothetical protein